MVNFVDLWATATYKPYPFPMNKIDNRSGQYVFGRDPGGNYNGWKPATDATRQMIRNAGWNEYSQRRGAQSRLLRRGACRVACRQARSATTRGNRPARRSTIPSPTCPNEARQVFGDATNGSFDHRAFFKSFNRTYGYTFDDVSLTDISETATGAYKLPFGINTSADLNLTADDTAVLSAPYSTCTIDYDSATTTTPSAPDRTRSRKRSTIPR